MTGIWKDTNKNFIKDKLSWYTKHDKFTYERNLTHTWLYPEDIDINERFMNVEFKEYQQYTMKIKVPINEEGDYNQFEIMCYYIKDRFDPLKWSIYDFMFSEENTFSTIESLIKITYKNRDNIKFNNVGDFFYWRNLYFEPTDVIVIPLLSFEQILYMYYYKQTTNEPKHMLYKPFINTKLKSIKIDQTLIKPKLDIYEQEIQELINKNFKVKSSKDLYTNKELQEFKTYTKLKDYKYLDTYDKFEDEAYWEADTDSSEYHYNPKFKGERHQDYDWMNYSDTDKLYSIQQNLYY